MDKEYLPGTVQDRITDLMKGHKVMQADLARCIGVNREALNQFGQALTVLMKSTLKPPAQETDDAGSEQ